MRRSWIALLLFSSACTAGVGGSEIDAGFGPDLGLASDAAPTQDGGFDAAPADQGVPDTGPRDQGFAGTDAGAEDADPADLGVADQGQSGTLVLVAVGYGNRRTSSFDGMNWGDDQVVDPNGGDDNNLLRGVGLADGRFVAVGGGGEGQSWVSDDGRTWTHHVTALRAFLSDAVYGNGVWVTAGGNGLRLVSTDRGESWHGDPGYYAGHFRGLAFGNGVFVAAGHRYGASTDGLTAVSSDGLQWDLLEHNGLAGFSAVIFAQGLFVATGQTGRLAVSSDGRQWDELSLGSNSLDGPSFANGEIVVPSPDGIYRSSDGRSYIRVDGFVPGSVQYVFGRYVGSTWRSQRWSTPALGTAWTRTHQDDGPAFTELIWGYVQ